MQYKMLYDYTNGAKMLFNITDEQTQIQIIILKNI